MKTSENKDKIQYHWIDLSRRLHNSFFLRIDFFKGKLMFRYLGVRSSGFNWNCQLFNFSATQYSDKIVLLK